MITNEVNAEVNGLSARWGWVVFRGVVAILFGLVAFSRPGATTLSLVLLFGVYAFVGGIAAILAALRRGRAGSNWGALLIDGLLGVAAGVVAVVWPASTALAFVWLIGAWAIITGALEIVGAIRLRKLIAHEWALGLAGAVSIVFGLLLLYRPLAGGLTLIWLLGAYALAFGVLMLVLGFRLRSVGHHLAQGLPQPG